MNVHKVNILGWHRMQVAKLTHQFQEAVAFVGLILFQFPFFKHHVRLCFVLIFVKSEIVNHVDPQKDIWLKTFSQFLNNLFEAKTLKIFVFI
jgi:hypothetical protein